jgi:hypothetical protein
MGTVSLHRFSCDSTNSTARANPENAYYTGLFAFFMHVAFQNASCFSMQCSSNGNAQDLGVAAF